VNSDDRFVGAAFDHAEGLAQHRGRRSSRPEHCDYGKTIARCGLQIEAGEKCHAVLPLGAVAYIAIMSTVRALSATVQGWFCGVPPLGGSVPQKERERWFAAPLIRGEDHEDSSAEGMVPPLRFVRSG
jgi:hypothetical protein